MSIATAKVPLVVTSSVICLGLGLLGGAAGMAWLDSQPWYQQRAAADENAPPADAKQNGGPPMGMGGMPKGGPGGMPKGGPGGMPMGGPGGMKGKGPDSKAQLASLVQKLDLLTGKPLKFDLSTQQQIQLAEQLQGLEDIKELSEEEAKKRLDKVLEILNDKADVLKAVGYRLPGEKLQQPAAAPNPFMEEPNRKALKELRQRLAPPVS
jgi:hypothetical protein